MLRRHKKCADCKTLQIFQFANSIWCGNINIFFFFLVGMVVLNNFSFTFVYFLYTIHLCMYLLYVSSVLSMIQYSLIRGAISPN